MRTVVSWAWFRPSEKAWEKGARWYRCDVVGGGEQSKRFVDLPTTARGLLEGKPKDKWLVCVNGDSVQSAPKIPCTEPHVWRAVTTIKVGQPEDPYPGDRLVKVATHDYCSGLGGRLARLPARVRLRLHLVPRGRVESRQPALGLLGEDLGVSWLAALLFVATLRPWRAAPATTTRPPSSTPSAGPTAAAAPPTAAPAPPRPQAARVPPPAELRRGARSYRQDRIVSSQGAAHGTGARIYAVGQLRTVIDGHLVAVDSAQVQEQVARVCPRKLDYVPRHHRRRAAADHAESRSGSHRAWSSPTPARTGSAATSSPSPGTPGWRGSGDRCQAALAEPHGRRHLRHVRRRPLPTTLPSSGSCAGRTTPGAPSRPSTCLERGRPGEKRVRATSHLRSRTPAARWPRTRSTRSGATSGRRPSSGPPARTTAAAGHRSRSTI